MSRARANIQDINTFAVNAEQESDAAEQVNSALQDIDNINAEIDNAITTIEGVLGQCEQAETHINSVVDELQQKYDEIQAQLDALISQEPTPEEELVTESDYDSEGNVISSNSYWQETDEHAAWSSEVVSVEVELRAVSEKLNTAQGLHEKIQNKIDELTRLIDTLNNIKTNNEEYKEQLSEYCQEIIDSSQSAYTQLKNALDALELYLAEMVNIVSSPLCSNFTWNSSTDNIKNGNESKYNNCPINGNSGQWTGVRGESKWVPTSEYIPKEKSRSKDKPYSNPENLTMGEIMEKYGFTGILFSDGEPSFDEVSRKTVMIEGFSESKTDNFDLADAKLAKELGCNPEEVTAWRKANNYTWHECRDMRTMKKVPNEVHANISHKGGRSIIKNQTVTRR